MGELERPPGWEQTWLVDADALRLARQRVSIELEADRFVASPLSAADVVRYGRAYRSRSMLLLRFAEYRLLRAAFPRIRAYRNGRDPVRRLLDSPPHVRSTVITAVLKHFMGDAVAEVT